MCRCVCVWLLGGATFFVMTKLVPAQSTDVSQWSGSTPFRHHQRGGGRVEAVPIAKLDVMANARPIYLQSAQTIHQRE